MLTERLREGSPRSLVHYAELTSDWPSHATRVRNVLGLRLDPARDVSSHPVDGFIDPKLRRRLPGWDQSSVPRFLQELGEKVFQALGDVAGNGNSQERAACVDLLGEEYRTLHSDALDLARAHIMRHRTAAAQEARRKDRANARHRGEAAYDASARQDARRTETEHAQLRARVSELESSWVPAVPRDRLSPLQGRSHS